MCIPTTPPIMPRMEPVCELLDPSLVPLSLLPPAVFEPPLALLPYVAPEPLSSPPKFAEEIPEPEKLLPVLVAPGTIPPTEVGVFPC